MSFLNSLWNEIIGFFGVNQFLTILQKQDYALLLNSDVITAPGITNQLRYLFYPPGWSHESGHQTAKMIRKAYLTKNE